MKDIISAKDNRIILTEMCKRVGIEYESVDFSHDQWYVEHEWTHKEENDFIIWLGKFLRQHHYVGTGTKHGRDWGEYEASKLVCNYGWKYKD